MLPTTLSAQHIAQWQPAADEIPSRWTEPEEMLVADARGRLTPSQMVDQKLQTMGGSCARSLHPVNRDPRCVQNSWHLQSEMG